MALSLGNIPTNQQYYYVRKGRSGNNPSDIALTPEGGEQFWTKTTNPNYKPESTGNSLSNFSVNDALANSNASMDEAKQKTEASKVNALGYLKNVDNEFSKLGDLISPDQQAQLQANRKANIVASGQNTASAFGDSDSGINQGILQRIAQNTTAQASNLPIQTQLDVAGQNRSAKVEALGMRSNIANAMANVEQNYTYDPGDDYISQLGEALGMSNSNASTNTPTSSVSTDQKKANYQTALADYLKKRKTGYTGKDGVHVDTSGKGYVFNYKS